MPPASAFQHPVSQSGTWAFRYQTGSLYSGIRLALAWTFLFIPVYPDWPDARQSGILAFFQKSPDTSGTWSTRQTTRTCMTLHSGAMRYGMDGRQCYVCRHRHAAVLVPGSPSGEAECLSQIYSSVTDATLTHNPDYQWTGGPWRFSSDNQLFLVIWRSAVQISAVATYLLLLLRILHNWWLPDVIWPRSIASDLRSIYVAFASSISLATTPTTKRSPLHPAPSSSPGGALSPSFLSKLLTPLSVGGKYVTDATLTYNPDYQWTGGPWRSSGITTFS
jgi:hypothetical protein